jgi:hypothetical protein
MITVISTSNAAQSREKCLLSVQAQRLVDYEHVYIDATEQVPPRSPLANVIEAVNALPDDRVVAFVDGDDWLCRFDALLIVERMHKAGALVTYGSFRFADGRPATWQGAYKPGENVRTTQWRASHLKTCRAGLFKRIRQADLELDGELLQHARDMAVMFPLLEMAGDRAVFCSEILYTYNFANSTEFRGTPEVWAAEKRCVEYVRGLPTYSEIDSL